MKLNAFLLKSTVVAALHRSQKRVEQSEKGQQQQVLDGMRQQARQMEQQARSQTAARIAEYNEGTWSPSYASFSLNSPQSATFNLLTPSGGVMMNMVVRLTNLTRDPSDPRVYTGNIIVDALNSSGCTILVGGMFYGATDPFKDLGDLELRAGERKQGNSESGRFAIMANLVTLRLNRPIVSDCR